MRPAYCRIRTRTLLRACLWHETIILKLMDAFQQWTLFLNYLQSSTRVKLSKTLSLSLSYSFHSSLSSLLASRWLTADVTNIHVRETLKTTSYKRISKKQNDGIYTSRHGVMPTMRNANITNTVYQLSLGLLIS